MPRAIAKKTYKEYMKKYNLPLMIVYERNDKRIYAYKTIPQMSEEIYNYETQTDDIVRGLYYV